MPKYVIVFCCLLLSFSGNSFAEDLQLETNSGAEISVSRYKSQSGKTENVLLWIPTEYGIRGKEANTAKELTKKGIEVWIADIHSSYFIPPGRRSYNDIPLSDITDLILAVKKETKARDVILFATGRAAPLALQAARQLQLNPNTADIIKRAVLFHPNFYKHTTIVGKNIEYIDITRATNLALYIVQPSLSGKHYQTNTLKKQLQQGGSDVIIHALKGANDGFNVLPTRNKKEESFYLQTPSIISRAITFLSHYDKPRVAAKLGKSNSAPVASISPGLQVYRGNISNPLLNFNDLQGVPHSLKKHKGKVLLLNFWATWCPPCVKELPSLNRLRNKVNNENFKILAIDIGEETETVKQFLKPMEIEFSVLTDPEGESVKPWNLIAFPSSFVIDKHGKIRYGLFGAIEWDDPEVIKIIQKLLQES